MIFNIHHPSELELAEKLCELIPSCEMISYFTGGSGATTGAVKIARGFTGRDKIICCGYHGWHDWCDQRERGVPRVVQALTISIRYNDTDALKEALEANKGEVAVFMLEAFQGSGPTGTYLADVKDLCAKHGVLLCFDEVKTGFRFALGGYQEYCGVTPDLSTFGKALGNGYDVAFVVGKREIMETVPDVWIAATFHGQLLGVAAALATIKEMKAIDGISLIWKQGQKLIDGMQEIMQRRDINARMVGLPPMPHLAFEKGLEELRDDFYEGTADRGVYFDPGHCWFISPAHTDDIISYTLQAADEAAAALSSNSKGV
jgi:glutamate-1-semialdehyde aminotransferase